MEVKITTCLDCAQGFHNDCGSPCCCADKETVITSDDSATPVISIPDTPILPVASSPVSTGERDGMKWSKQDHALKDLKSTGRKRAAVLYPLDREAPCEWRNLRFAGGGLYPIVGCATGNQEHRHHGPILLTTANVEGNVHRICTTCHNSWHAANDAYVKILMHTTMWRPHDPNTLATAEEQQAADNLGRGRYAAMRFAYREYRKDRDNFKDYLELLKSRGVEVVNSFLGV